MFHLRQLKWKYYILIQMKNTIQKLTRSIDKDGKVHSVRGHYTMETSYPKLVTHKSNFLCRKYILVDPLENE